jgi:uncharacterized membrane protein YphA (DoxX/SURF4 family)
VIQLYLLAFCRVVIALVFILSFVGKVRNISAFEQTIANFKFIPGRFNRFTALMVLIGEVIVVASMVIGSQWLWPGFLLAALMLVIFCVALASVLIRRIQTSCNCFGSSKKFVSSYDILRNAGFTTCSLGGCGMLSSSHGNLVMPSWIEWGLVGMVAFIFVEVWIHLGEFVELLHKTKLPVT